MLAREEDALMIPVIGTCLRVVEVGVIAFVVFEDGAMAGFVSIATLVGQSAILTFVPI
jgi:hypothetical protein